MTETFYELLGVSADATTEEIESAYREAIKEVHPDVSDASDASQRTKRLNKAKRVLTDDEERARYDRVGHAAYTHDGPRPSSSPGSATGRSGDESAAHSRNRGRRTRHRSGRHGRRSDRTGDGRDRRGSPNGAADGNRRGDDGEEQSGGDSDRTGNDAERSGTTAGGRTEAKTSADASGATRSWTFSQGPSWQSQSTGSSGASGGSQSAQRQAAASGPDNANVDWSWNPWNPGKAWAVRRGGRSRGLHPARLFPTDQSLVLIASTMFCYPFFVGSVLFPPFPLFIRLTVLVCTLFMFAYLLSIPEVAILVYGFWSVVGTLGLLVWPSVNLLSLLGVIVVTATWVPLGLSILTFRILRP